MNDNKEVAIITESNKAVNYFGDQRSFEHVQRVAAMFSKSDLVPARYKNNPANCIIAIEMASRIGASPLLVMQNLDVIQGKPGWSSTFLIASINSCGKFSPLRYEEDTEDGGRTRAWAYDVTNKEKLFGAWVSMTMAKAEGWTEKNGSKWKTMPELMRRYRAASFFSRQFAPEVSMGMLTIEEVVDITPFQPATVVRYDKEKERLLALISDCKTPEELQVLEIHLTDDTREAYNVKAAELGAPKSEDRKEKLHNLATQVKQ